ncbi:hypothetical protein pb186bvf_009716 [Paramecium bursaria]
MHFYLLEDKNINPMVLPQLQQKHEQNYTQDESQYSLFELFRQTNKLGHIVSNKTQNNLNQKLRNIFTSSQDSPRKKLQIFNKKRQQSTSRNNQPEKDSYYDRVRQSIKRQQRFSIDYSISTPRNAPNEQMQFRLFSNDQQRIDKQQLINRLTARYNSKIAQVLSTLFQLPYSMDFYTWKNLKDKIIKLHHEGCIVIAFRLFDQNGDKFICSKDLFKMQMSIKSAPIDRDIKLILNFAKNYLNTMKIDDEELIYLQKSLIFKESLNISDILTWKDVYQQDQTQEMRNKKGLNYQRQFPFKNFIGSKYFFGEEDESQELLVKRFLEKYPHKFKEVLYGNDS